MKIITGNKIKVGFYLGDEWENGDFQKMFPFQIFSFTYDALSAPALEHLPLVLELCSCVNETSIVHK